MSTEIILEVINNTENKNTSQEGNDYNSELLALISEMNIVDFEPNLSEDLNSKFSDSFPGKYHILAILRDLFLEFKNAGDEQIIVEEGTCGHKCNHKCQIINLQGKTSGKNFAFGLDKTEHNIINFHTCYGFVNKNNEPQYIDGDMMMNSFRKAAELKGKDTTMYDDKMKDIFMTAIEIFHE